MDSSTSGSLPLARKLTTLPTAPGVYQFKNSRGEVIYVGKARSLRNRVRSYFRRAGFTDAKTIRMIAQVADLDIIVTESEVEALILEANLCRELMPKYNIRLKDDKHFPYVKVTTQEPFPRILIVRHVDNDGAAYFGPYTSGLAMRKSVEYLRRLFNIRTCSLTIPHPQGKPQPVCLMYHIKRCGGPCAGHQSEAAYRPLVEGVLMVLAGKTRSLIESLQEEMRVASRDLQFEEAVRLRDRIQALESMMVKQNVDVAQLVDVDILALARESDLAVIVGMQIREGALLGRQDFQLHTDPDDSAGEILRTFIHQHYSRQANLPSELFLPEEIPDHRLTEKWLSERRGRKVALVTPKLGRKVKIVELAGTNARLLLDELLIQRKTRSQRTSKMVVALKDSLSLPADPVRIVCFDISNTGETDAVGSAVLFENGVPKKSGYRHFKIKGVSGQDDFKMMREIVGRYFHRLKEEGAAMPDLVVVDGGKGQLSSARAELQSLDLATQPIIGLAKRLEEIFLPGKSEPMTVPKASPALLLLKRIRDEAHRFAITYNRKVRTHRTIKTSLTNISGLGEARSVLLLKHFGSPARVAAASTEELVQVRGISKRLAGQIYEHFHGDKSAAGRDE